mgnify:CR=1 FL=1
MREDTERRDVRWGRLKGFAGVVTAAFMVTLAVVVGNRLSEEALGVLAGTVCGVGAAIPTSLLVVAASKRQGESQAADVRRMRERPGSYVPAQQYPPVVVISPADARTSRPSWNALPSSLSAPADRDFRIVGGPSMDLEGVRYDDERRA